MNQIIICPKTQTCVDQGGHHDQVLYHVEKDQPHHLLPHLPPLVAEMCQVSVFCVPVAEQVGLMNVPQGMEDLLEETGAPEKNNNTLLF